jgi:hypothetical protein
LSDSVTCHSPMNKSTWIFHLYPISFTKHCKDESSRIISNWKSIRIWRSCKCLRISNCCDLWISCSGTTWWSLIYYNSSGILIWCN